MSDPTKQNDWTKPAAMAIPKGGYLKDKVEQGRYGPIFPKTPACYGFTIIAKIIPGREDVFYEYAKNIEQAVAGKPDCLAILKLHYLRWVLFPIKGETYFMYQGIFDTDFDKYTEDAVASSRISASERSSKTSRAFRRTGRRMRQRSSSSFVNTSARAFSNTASIRM